MATKLKLVNRYTRSSRNHYEGYTVADMVRDNEASGIHQVEDTCPDVYGYDFF